MGYVIFVIRCRKFLFDWQTTPSSYER